MNSIELLCDFFSGMLTLPGYEMGNIGIEPVYLLSGFVNHKEHE